MIKEMFMPMANSPEAQLTESIDSSTTTIKVDNIDALPQAPNLAVIGIGVDAETIKYTGKQNGVLSGCVRGFEGVAKGWEKGTPIARNFTAHDHNTLIDNVKDLEENKIAITGNANDLKVDVEDIEGVESNSSLKDYFLKVVRWIKDLKSDKQDNLTAGSNIRIENNKISAKDTVYTHPDKHKPSEIETDEDNRFVTDEEKKTWNGKQDKLIIGTDLVKAGNTISANVPVKAVNSKTGYVTITKSDLGLGMVENIGIVILSQSQYDALSSTEKARKDKLYGVYDG